MAQDSVTDVVGDSASLEKFRAFFGMEVFGGVDFPIEIVQEPGDAPLLFVFVEEASVSLHDGLDRDSVAACALFLRILKEDVPGLFAMHLAGLPESDSGKWYPVRGKSTKRGKRFLLDTPLCIQFPSVEQSRLIAAFRRWSEIEAVSNLSPLYGVLGHTVADSPELLALANEALPGQPPPNIIFGAVHALLASNLDDPLAKYYATLGGTLPATAAAGEVFRTFCMSHRDELLPVIRTRLVQTNEVRRSSLLMPAFAAVSEDAGKPLALFEIGPSAGLNLLFDRYLYRYGDYEAGDSTSPLVLECEPRGDTPAVTLPVVTSRVGIDINPLDVSNTADVAWLRALVWPEHTDRLKLLNAALEVARRSPPELLRGDVFELLPGRITETAEDSVVCVFATFVLHQFTPAMRARLRRALEALSRSRAIYLVQIGCPRFIEPGSQLDGDEQVWILRIRDGVGQYRISSVANPHGRWLKWQAESPWQPWVGEET